MAPLTADELRGDTLFEGHYLPCARESLAVARPHIEREAREKAKNDLRDSFDAGVEQGSDEATSYDWGGPPRRKRDEAFQDFLDEREARLARVMEATHAD